MADKFISQVNGTLTETNPATSSAGAGSAGKIVALDNTGKLDQSLLPTGIGADTAAIIASEDLAAGEFVNIYDDAGTTKCRLADATTSGKQAHGFVLNAVTSGASATVYFEGTNNQVTGATGGNVFLATTAGGFTLTPPSAAGNIVQRIGVATSSASINVEVGQPIVLA